MRVRKRKEKLNADQVSHLLQGWCLGNVNPFLSEDHRRACWLANRDFLINITSKEKCKEIFGFSIFGCFPLEKGELPQAYLDYEGKKRMSLTAAKNRL